jgi:hypothetical protein
MHGRGRPGLWLVLVLLGTVTTLSAFGWIGSSLPAGRNGVHDAGADGFFSSLTFLAALVPIPPAPAAPVPEPRVSIRSILGFAPPSPPPG